MKPKYGWLYQLNWLFPALAFILVFAAFPIYVVFHNATNGRPNSGLYQFSFYQFKQIFTDVNFTNALINTTIYTVCAIPLTLFISLLIAKGISKLTHPRILQSAFFLPFLTSTLAIGMIFQVLFAPQNQNDATIKVVLIVFGTFSALPFRIIMFTSAFLAVDKNLYRAASADGIPNWQQFFKIDLVEVFPIILYSLTTGIINGFKFLPFGLFFSYDQAVAKGGHTIVYYIYSQINEFQNYGKAGASSVTLMFFILILTVLNRLIWTRKKKTNYEKNKKTRHTSLVNSGRPLGN